MDMRVDGPPEPSRRRMELGIASCLCGSRVVTWVLFSHQSGAFEIEGGGVSETLSRINASSNARNTAACPVRVHCERSLSVVTKALDFVTSLMIPQLNHYLAFEVIQSRSCTS